MIEIQHLNKTYGSGDQALHVLKDLSMHVTKGELVSIMGSSGSGKSTLLNILGCLDSFDTGSYRLNGIGVERMNESAAAKFRNRQLGFVFQAFNLLPYKNAIENVALPLYYQGVRRKERELKATEMLAKLGLGNRGLHFPNELSGGQKQRVAIARALITDPALILADEPTGALDSETTAEVMSLLRTIHAEGRTMIIVTHEQEIADETQRQIILRDGMVVSDQMNSAFPHKALTAQQ